MKRRQMKVEGKGAMRSLDREVGRQEKKKLEKKELLLHQMSEYFQPMRLQRIVGVLV